MKWPMIGMTLILIMLILVLVTVIHSKSTNPGSTTPPSAAASGASSTQTQRQLTKCIADRLTELDDRRPAYLADIKATGATCVRIDIEWRAVEKTPPQNGVGNYDFGDFDPIIIDIHAAGLKPILVLGYAPWWAAGRQDPDSCMGGEICAPLESAAAAFGMFTEATAQHYNQPQFGEVRAFEVWNEPNFEQYWPKVDPALYLKFFVSAKHGLRQANPDAIVITGGLAVAGDQAMLPVDFLNGMYAAGLHQHLDANTKIGFHPYTDGALPGQDNAQDGWSQMVLGQGVLEANGDGGIGFWITEVAWSTKDVSPAEQAALAAEMFWLLHTPGYHWVEVITWYTYRDDEAGMGLVTADEQPKPALAVFTKPA